MISLPSGVSGRPLSTRDLEAVTAVVAACELHDDGVVEISASDVAADWSRPAMDLASMSVGVFDGERLVAFGEVCDGRAEIDVDPAARGRGIGAALMKWSWGMARAAGRTDVGQTVTDNRVDAVSLFRAHGYEPRWTSWILHIDCENPPPSPVLPAGYAIRDFRPGPDDRAVYEVIEAAFREWPDRDPQTFENWRAISMGNDAFSAAMSPLIVKNDRIVGATICFSYEGEHEGWIHMVAVDRDERGLGLGRALLLDAFRRFSGQGRTRCGLSTDSRTGALGLYEHVGMTVRRSYTRWSKDLSD